MKKLALALGVVSLALTVSASPRNDYHEREHWMGRHEYNNVQTPQVAVPETTSTMVLAAIGLASLGFVGVFQNRKKI